MVIWVIVFVMMFNFFAVILIAGTIIKKVKQSNHRFTNNQYFSKPKEEVTEVDEVFGDVEDVWAKYDKK